MNSAIEIIVENRVPREELRDKRAVAKTHTRYTLQNMAIDFSNNLS